ncbi:MAG: hypothetical protein ACRDMW_07610 [Gaiellaceae bacterium]
MNGRTTSLRTGAAVVAVLAVLIFALNGTAAAPPGAAPVQIVDGSDSNRDAAVVEDGSLHVTGDVSVTGTSSVEVSNFPEVQEVEGTVDVGNFPEAEVATQFRSLVLVSSAPDETFAALDARLISIASEDEIGLTFFTPQGQRAIMIGDNRQPMQAISLPIAVPLASASLDCDNEVADCVVFVTIAGT